MHGDYVETNERHYIVGEYWGAPRTGVKEIESIVTKQFEFGKLVSETEVNLIETR